MAPFLTKYKELIIKTAIVLGMVALFLLGLEIIEELFDFIF